jgi:aspartokinase/homoserine dehydrogenase 1
MSVPSASAVAIAPRATRASGCVDLVLIGARGQVARALRAQLAREAGPIARRTGVALRLVAAFDRRGFIHDPHGLDPLGLETRLAPRTEDDWPRLRARLADAGPAGRVVIDCTACERVADQYVELLESGIAVATPNKHAGAGTLARWHALHAASARHGAPFRYETTVGAALPVLGTLAEVVRRGERVTRIEAVLSGSLSLILAQLHAGSSFGDALAAARERGFTEPDPREDLAARDLARKALILARVAGFAWEPATIDVQPLCAPGRWPDVSDDAAWRERADAATAEARRLVACVRIDGDGGSVAVRALEQADALARVAPGENLVRVFTEHHTPVPLTIAGPGAGPAVTAAGLLGDVIAAARELAGHA